MNPLASAVLATSIAFTAVSSEAAKPAAKPKQAVPQTFKFTITTKQNTFNIEAQNTYQDIFKNASSVVAEKVKDQTIKMNLDTGIVPWDVARIKNQHGAEIGKCKVLLDGDEGKISSVLKTYGMNYKHPHLPIEAKTYKAFCWIGSESEVNGVGTKFTYTPK